MLAHIGVIILLLSPVFLAVILWRRRCLTWLDWVMQVWFALTFTLFIFLTGRWDYLGYWARFGIFLPTVAAMVRSFLSIPAGTPFALLSAPGQKNAFFSYLVPTLILTIMNIVAFQGTFPQGSVAPLSFPLKNGTFYVAQAGSSALINYHHSSESQTYAIDIVSLNSWGLRAIGLGQTALNQYFIYGTPVYSPCDGTVSKVVDGLSDIEPGASGDFQNAAGNHIYLTCGHTQILLAHLKQGSLLTRVGDTVKTGAPLARVGNSGNSSEPHLHIHAQTDGNLTNVNSGKGLPIIFNNHYYIRNDILEE